MITDAIINFFFQTVVAIMDLFPDFQVPEWLDNIAGPVGTIFGYAGSLGAWLPLGLLKTVITVVIASYLIGVGIRFVRIVISLFTAGGGSAA